jgi:hypothetical protein
MRRSTDQELARCIEFAHTTAQEKAFLDGLGKWSAASGGRTGLLLNYHQAAALRRDWGALDRIQIETYCHRLLNEALNREEQAGGQS